MKYALNGILEAFKTQWNMKIHFLLTIVVVGLAFYLEISHIEWLVIVLCIGLIFMAEIANTAIEYLVDFVSPEIHPTAGKIKDLAAGAVLVAAITAFITGLLIFGPKLIALLP